MKSGDLVIGRSGDRTAASQSTLSVRRALQVAIAVLREIFDEGAYDRFLVRTQASRSVGSYRDFWRDREEATAQRPRCC